MDQADPMVHMITIKHADILISYHQIFVAELAWDIQLLWLIRIIFIMESWHCLGLSHNRLF